MASILNLKEIQARCDAIRNNDSTLGEKNFQAFILMRDFIRSISAPKNGFATAKNAKVIGELMTSLESLKLFTEEYIA